MTAQRKPVPELVEHTRRRMAPQDRRALILDVAQRLFLTRGWESVTIADVLEETRLSKGGFYHHFTAKEHLLDAIVARLTDQAIADATTARDRVGGDALSRFNAFLAASNRWSADRGPELRFFATVTARPGNDVLFQRIAAASAVALGPVLTEMIDTGVAEGRFDVPDVAMVAEAILALGPGRRHVLARAIAALDAGDIDTAQHHVDRRMAAEGAMVDRLLGLPTGSIVVSDQANTRRLLAGMVGA